MVDRQNSKHNPRVDEEMSHETASLVQGAPAEARSREDRRQEGPIDHPGYRPEAPGSPPGLPPETLELRSALAASLRPSALPGDRDGLISTARQEHAPDAVVRLLERLPAGRTWSSLEEVWEEAGGPGHRRPEAGSGGG